MRLGVISDVHANLQALETSLDFLRANVDRIVCLGDLVGYGPQPNEVVARVAELEISTVMGNHDLVAAGIDPLEKAGDNARATLEWTHGELSDASRAFLRDLPPTLEIDGEILAAHGAIDDPWRYVRRVPDAVEQLERMVEGGPHRLLLLGHTHRQMAVDTASGKTAMSEWVLARHTRTVAIAGTAFLNPGAVGQSREPRPVVRLATVDLAERKIRLHALRYPHERCKEVLRHRGLPPEWCHPAPTLKKTVRQVLRDSEDRRHPLHWNRDRSDIP
jgi:predicted phosphodiesterase